MNAITKSHCEAAALGSELRQELELYSQIGRWRTCAITICKVTIPGAGFLFSFLAAVIAHAASSSHTNPSCSAVFKAELFVSATTTEIKRAERALQQQEPQPYYMCTRRCGIDGVPGINLQGALCDFQADHGLPQTGQLDDPTKTALGMVPTQTAKKEGTLKDVDPSNHKMTVDIAQIIQVLGENPESTLAKLRKGD